MWPESIYIQEVAKKKERIENIRKIHEGWETIADHFDGVLESSWVDKHITSSYIMRYGVKIITERYGFCEYCHSYIGPTAMVRKLHNIPVINGYCRDLLRAVAPMNRCCKWEPKKFYQQLILNQIMEETKYNPDICSWLKPVDVYDEEDY